MKLQTVIAIALSGSLGAQVVTFELATDATGLTGVDNGQAAWIDYNDDGWTDLQTAEAIWGNDNGKKFVKDGPGGRHNAWADFNNDGFVDFFSAGTGIISFQNADGTYTATTLSDRMNKVSDGAACVDFDGNGLVDIYWGGYEFNGNNQPDSLYLNLDNGSRIVKVWHTKGPSQAARGITTCDFDNDGDTDIYISQYQLQPNALLINGGVGQKGSERTGQFGEGAAMQGVTGGNGNGIGSAWGDLDNDGLFDLFAANFAKHGQPQSRFLKNYGPEHGHRFKNMGQCGLHYQASYGSPALGDYDNDGDLDLFLTTIYADDAAVLYRNDGDWNFTNVTGEAGLRGIRSTTQAAWGDFDNDGDLDLMSGGQLWRNKGTAGNWLKVKLRGSDVRINRTAVGAQVRIKLGDKTLSRQVESSTGRGNMNDMTLHFGLGGYSENVELEISWPYIKGRQNAIAKVNTMLSIVMDVP